MLPEPLSYICVFGSVHKITGLQTEVVEHTHSPAFGALRVFTFDFKTSNPVVPLEDAVDRIASQLDTVK
jgi:hypothetical protein